MTSIEWTNETWNPVRGCSIVSAGCTNCYAMKYAHRFSSPGFPYEGLTASSKGGPVWTGAIRLVPGVLGKPIVWKTPRRIFVNSMSDLFHEDVPDEFIDRVFAVMVLAQRHTFQILTKRPKRMKDYISNGRGPMRRACWAFIYDAAKEFGPTPEIWPTWPPPNVWLGVSVEDQRSADERIPVLLQTPAAVRWISAEPLLGPIDLTPWISPIWAEGESYTPLDWVVVGGESGPKARQFDVAWARALLFQCRMQSVPIFVKQLGSNLAPIEVEGGSARERLFLKSRKGGDPSEWPEDLRVREYPA